MPFKSQQLKDEVIYPSNFTEEDKELFDQLYCEAKVKHDKEYKSDPWLIRYAIICYVNGANGRSEDIDPKEVEELRKAYELKTRIFETPESDDYKDADKYLINLPDDELKEKLNILTSNIENDNTPMTQPPPEADVNEQRKEIFDNMFKSNPLFKNVIPNNL